MYPLFIREEELKNRVAADWFGGYDCAAIIGNLDFCVSQPLMGEPWSFYWAEAKAGNKADIAESFTQLIITLGKEKPQEKKLPPAFLGAFDAEKIAFLPYHSILELFQLRDFNWQVTPSNHATPQFRQMLELVRPKLDADMTVFRFAADAAPLRSFIKANFKLGKADASQIEITKNNFVSIYYHWRANVMPSISVNWDNAKKAGLLSADFYLADILSKDNATLSDKLRVLLKSDHYEFDRSIDEIMGTSSVRSATFKDGGKAHTQFWNRYRRPPRREFWGYLVERRELLIPQDVRERKGSYFTPQCWVELSQKYIADVLGEDWQDEYYVWDCAAGTGNLLHGLVNKYRIFASTLDQADVDIMKERIAHGANLLESHVFQFDFLNDPLDSPKVPAKLKEILQDEEKRKKLVVYINPPYAEHGNRKQVTGTGENKSGVAVENKTHQDFHELIGPAARELFAQFLIRIATEISGCVLAQFSTLKTVQASNFEKFRQSFKASLKKTFLVPASSFDNVKGQFPIGFFIWHTGEKGAFENLIADVFNSKKEFLCQKQIHQYDNVRSMNDWIFPYRDKTTTEKIAYISIRAPEFQNSNYISILRDIKLISSPRGSWITSNNLIEHAVYFSVRHVIPATWLNDRDQYLYPHDSWKEDRRFQTDCLAYTLFSNNIQAEHGVNHWIPFTPHEVGAKEDFASHFMTDYMRGKIKPAKMEQGSLLAPAHSSIPTAPLEFSPEARAVFDAGRKLWTYYHTKPDAVTDAALYDIKEHFQGRDKSGKMNTSSDDATYNALMADLRSTLKTLAEAIEPKVYQHGFLLR